MDILNDYIELVYGFELTDMYTINQITRVLGYLKDNRYNDEDIMHYLLRNGPVISDVLFNGLTKCVVYYNNELVIESKAPVWHPEKGTDTTAYYREPRCNFSINDLLDMYYSKLKIPYELQDRKRDTGAFNHMLNKYKFTNFTSLDYIVTLIKLAEENEMVVSEPFDINEYNTEAYNMLSTLAQYNKTNIVWRNK